MPSSTVEDYLKHLYVLQDPEGKLVPTGRLAQSLGVSPGTATLMVKTLFDAGLVEYEVRAGVRLSERGRKLALHVLRRHRLIELFLVQVLNLDWSEVHEEAEVLEHAVSDKVLERIDDLLGRPRVDPHGDPIPTATGDIERRQAYQLSSVGQGQTVRIASVQDQNPEFLQFAEQRGLKPGQRLAVTEVDAVAGTITVRAEGSSAVTLAREAAGKFTVCFE